MKGGTAQRSHTSPLLVSCRTHTTASLHHVHLCLQCQPVSEDLDLVRNTSEDDTLREEDEGEKPCLSCKYSI